MKFRRLRSPKHHLGRNRAIVRNGRSLSIGSAHHERAREKLGVATHPGVVHPLNGVATHPGVVHPLNGVATKEDGPMESLGGETRGAAATASALPIINLPLAHGRKTLLHPRLVAALKAGTVTGAAMATAASGVSVPAPREGREENPSATRVGSGKLLLPYLHR
jgi:hypothetical protein